MCLRERGKFATQALFSVHVMALGSTNREVNMTAGEMLLETKQAVSSALLAIWPPSNTNNEAFVFEPAFLLLNTTKAQTKLRKSQQYLRTASTAEQPSIGPAQSSEVHKVGTFVSTSMRQRKQAGMKEQVRCC